MEDKQLIKRIQRGEIERLDSLIEKYYNKIYSFCYRKTGNATTAYDLTQEVFLKLVRYINTYVDKQKFQSYLFTIALNICNDYYRNNRMTDEDIGDTEIVSPIDRISDFETADVVKAALNTLPDIQKDVIILRYYHDMKVREIAKIVGASIPTTKSRLKQGIDKLRITLGEEIIFNG